MANSAPSCTQLVPLCLVQVGCDPVYSPEKVKNRSRLVIQLSYMSDSFIRELASQLVSQLVSWSVSLLASYPVSQLAG